MGRMEDELVAALGSALLALAIRLGLIVLLAGGVIRLISILTRRFSAGIAQRHGADPARRARLQTLLTTGSHTLVVVVVVLAALMGLYALGLNIAPVLAGVGVAGLAVSLGAQAVIRDFIGGVLILVENQYGVGDVIQVGTVAGTVEQITLRATSVRDVEGRLWVVPNGDVRVVSNQTRDWSRAVVDLSIPYTSDMARLMPALEASLLRAAQDPSAEAALLEAPQVQGWNSLSDAGVQVRVTAKTAPGRQWDVARTLRQYAVGGLREAGLWAQEN